MIYRMRPIPLILKLRLSGKILSRYIWSHRACLQDSETPYKTIKQSTDILDSKAVSHKYAMLCHVKENMENEIYFIVKNLSAKKKSISHQNAHQREKQVSEFKSEVKSLSRVQLFATQCTVAYQAPLPAGFSRQECWSGLPFPSPGDLPYTGIEPRSPALQADALPSEPPTPRPRLGWRPRGATPHPRSGSCTGAGGLRGATPHSRSGGVAVI